jgi:heme-degrading monooxygenase HmoA
VKVQALTFALVSVLVTGCELAQPFEGPGYSSSDGLTSDAEGPFTVSTTKLILKDGDSEAQGIFDAHTDVMTEALKTAPGLVGLSSSGTIGGATYRTLSVWESEEDMLGWVTSAAHGEAMSAMADHSDPKSSVTSWTMTRSELTAAPPLGDVNYKLPPTTTTSPLELPTSSAS